MAASRLSVGSSAGPATACEDRARAPYVSGIARIVRRPVMGPCCRLLHLPSQTRTVDTMTTARASTREESTAFLRRAVETSDQPVAIVDVPTRRLLSASRVLASWY